MKGKGKRIFEGNIQILSKTSRNRGRWKGDTKCSSTQDVPERSDPVMAVLDGSVVLGELAPIPQPKEAVGEHVGDQMFSAVDGPVPCLVYLQDKEKTQSSARVEKQYPGIGLELGMKLELPLRKGLWQWEEGWGQLWGTQMAPALP